MRVTVGLVLLEPADDQVVAVEGAVEALDDHGASAGGDQGRTAACEHVEAVVQAAAVAGRAELAHRPAEAVRGEDRIAVAP